MAILKGLLKLIGSLIIILIVSMIGYCAWVLIAFQDIPVGELEAEFGGDNLQQVIIYGVPIRYKDEGLKTPEAPVLLLIHSHYYTMRQWQVWVDELKDHFRIVRYDLTSHGLTGPDPTEDYSYQRGVTLAAGLIEHLGIDSLSIAGSSTGGALAFRYAAQYPEQVESLILINTPGMPKMTNKYADTKLPAWGWLVFYLLPESLFRNFLEFPVIDKSLVTDAMVREFHQMYRREGNRRAEYLRMSTWDKTDPSVIIALVKAPTLLLWGRENPQLSADHVEEFKRRLLSAERVESKIYPNIGHVIPIENPYQSAQDTRRFIEASF